MDILDAVSKGDLQAVKSLINSIVNVDEIYKSSWLISYKERKQKMTLLLIAANLGFTEIVKLLIDAGANVNAKDE